MVSAPAAVRFTAYASTLSGLVVMAGFLPIVVAALCNLVLHPQSPAWARVVGAVIIAPVLVYYGIALRLCFSREPVIDIDETGLLWRRWSETRIPWSAFARWKTKNTLGQRYVTLWLRDRSAYRSTTVNRFLAIGNRGLGYGDLTLSPGGLDGRFEDLVAAIQAHAPAQRSGSQAR